MDPSDAIREAETLWNMGRLDEEISLDVAQRRYEQALALVEPLLETVPDALRVAATVHYELADVFRQREDFQRVEEHAAKALELREAFAPDSLSAAYDHQMVAYAAALRGDHETALRHYTRALEIAEPDNPQGASAFENGIADCHLHLGDLDKAARHYRASLEHARRSDKPEAVAAALNNLGTATRARGDFEQALEYHETAYDALADVGPTSLQAAMIIQQIAVDQHALGGLERALRTFQRSVSLSQRHAPGTMRVGSVLLDLGEAQVDDGRADEAVQSYRSALEIFDRMGPSSPASVKTRLRLGAALSSMGRPRDALDELLPALELEEAAAPGSQLVIRGLTDAGLARRALGEDDLAIGLFERAVELAEGLRARAGGERARQQVFALQQSPYQALIGCLARRGADGDDRLAFDYAERARARNLADLLVERDLDLHPENEEQARLLTEERELRSRLAALYNRMAAARTAGRAAAKELDELADEQRSAREELEGVLTQLRDPDTGFRTYAELRYPEPLTQSQVQALLDEDTLLLAYTTADEELLLFAVRRDELELVPLGVAPGRLAELIETAIGSYRRCEDAGAESDGARAELSRLLLSPVPSELLEGVERLVIVPDGAAFYLPFELLPLDAGVLLGERYVASYAPSATVLGALAATDPASGAAQFVGFGDPVFTSGEDDEDGVAAHLFRSGGRALPALPGTRRELERIREAFASGKAILRLGADATEHRIKNESNGYRFVHFATHGLLDDRDPLYSGLAVSPPAPGEPEGGDDFLQTYELFGLPLRETELVVLSCCQTGLGRIQTGEGLVGMTRALFFAGARCVVVSLWPVPDLPTARLMERFYGFLAEGDRPALALKRAKESVRKSHPAVYRDPASWAAFIPVGLG